MYIILIGYLYVIFMIAAASGSLVKGGAFLFFLGLLPTWLVVWLKRRGQVKRVAYLAEKRADAAAKQAWQAQQAAAETAPAEPRAD